VASAPASSPVASVGQRLLTARLARRVITPVVARRVVPGVLVSTVLVTWLWVALPLGDLQRAAAEAGPAVGATVAVVSMSVYALALTQRRLVILRGRKT